ncbi:hypothetical protein CCYA_CCYA13G3437 [Cyanidiococcus yangmingshanensis]|nr:hypothetical protein CCYA_CCYA13G3437 [Cyanidiococcus yangmingshanensis]
MKKRVDERVRQVLTRAFVSYTRALFFVVGDHAKDQVPFFYHLLTRIGTRPRPDVLWMYKKELGFSSHRRKRLRQLRKQLRRSRAAVDPSSEDLFELFVSTANIRFAYYAESDKVLGNTYGLLVLQDFEALTPNLLARTIETVQGGGLVLFLLHTMDSLRELYSLKMDVHAHFRTEACQDLVPRFNRRLVLSLEQCPVALALDDELNVLPAIGGATSTHPIVQANGYHEAAATSASNVPSVESTVPNVVADTNVRMLDSANSSEAEQRLRALEACWASVSDQHPLSVLVRRTKTLDQARVLEKLDSQLREMNIEQPASKSMASLAVLTAARGRGKSAALGLAAALALAHGYSSVVVTAPAPENLQTFFELLLLGLNDLGYREHLDYTVESRRDRLVTRLDIHRCRLQQVRYVEPEAVRRADLTSNGVLVGADLLIIDEAAAIPLALVKQILSLVPNSSCHVFLSSTVFGYEGTGRSLSLKLIEQARRHARQRLAATTTSTPTEHLAKAAETGRATDLANAQSCALSEAPSSLHARHLVELLLEEPIRYARNDPVEAWLHALLCLETTEAPTLQARALSHPSTCTLCEVNRDVLFSGHPVAEAFLHRIMALFVSSHYKNSPNDLQMLSDAPNQRLYVLLAPCTAESKRLPDVLCAIQLGLEGRLSTEHTHAQLLRGKRSAGDLIPWTIAQQFQEPAFAQLAGARIIRIATHPDVQAMGYGSRAMECLIEHWSAHKTSPSSMSTSTSLGVNSGSALTSTGLDTGDRAVPEPLLYRIAERPSMALDYVGVSFGLSHGLYRFWRRLGLMPVYIRLTANEITAEHTCIMIRGLNAKHLPGIQALHLDWRTRFLSLLGYDLRTLPLGLALDLLRSGSNGARPWSIAELGNLLSMHDLQRLAAYAQHTLDYHVILDLVPTLARLYFEGRFATECITLSPAQQAILLGMGLQHRSLDDLSADMDLGSAQLLALFGKICRKFATEWKRLAEEAASADLPQDPSLQPSFAQEANGFASASALDSPKTRADDDGNVPDQAQVDREELSDTNLRKLGNRRALARFRTIESAVLNVDDSPLASVVSLPARKPKL